MGAKEFSRDLLPALRGQTILEFQGNNRDKTSRNAGILLVPVTDIIRLEHACPSKRRVPFALTVHEIQGLGIRLRHAGEAAPVPLGTVVHPLDRGCGGRTNGWRKPPDHHRLRSRSRYAQRKKRCNSKYFRGHIGTFGSGHPAPALAVSRQVQSPDHFRSLRNRLFYKRIFKAFGFRHPSALPICQDRPASLKNPSWNQPFAESVSLTGGVSEKTLLRASHDEAGRPSPKSPTPAESSPPNSRRTGRDRRSSPPSGAVCRRVGGSRRKIRSIAQSR